ncbi:hypothetical protein [Propioniciclava coleopterorum]|uniref:hypothetical protein n=1 Tax=Propioniciclava coleopterorum TaxID=2714937 RepID=UPI00202B77D6|nr:hypothetical protein [Propioniciclava coleopterorum]
MSVHTSEMFAKNLLNFSTPMIVDGVLSIDWSDEVIAGTALTHGGAVVHAGVAKVLGLPTAPLPVPSPEEEASA